MVIPAIRLHLDVLADHIKSHCFCLFDVESESLIGGRGIQAIWPPALIQRSILKQKLIVQHHPLNAFVIRLHRDLSHGEITADLIDDLALSHHGDLQVVEKRILR